MARKLKQDFKVRSWWSLSEVLRLEAGGPPRWTIGPSLKTQIYNRLSSEQTEHSCFAAQADSYICCDRKSSIDVHVRYLNVRAIHSLYLAIYCK